MDAEKIKEDVEKVLGYKTDYWFGFHNNELCISLIPNNYNDNVMYEKSFYNGQPEDDYNDSINQISKLIRFLNE